MDPRTETRVRDGRLFKSGELLRRRLVHEGTLLWKTSGARLKGTQHCAKNTNKSVIVVLHRPRLCEVNLVLHSYGFRTPLKISNRNQLTMTTVRQRGIVSQGEDHKISQLQGGNNRLCVMKVASQNIF